MKNRLMASLLFSEYLHEKAEESRHNETISYMIIIIGSVFFVGGLLENNNNSRIERCGSRLVSDISVPLAPNPDSLLGTSLTSVSIVLIVLE